MIFCLLITSTEKASDDTAEFSGRETRVMVVVWNLTVHKYCREPASTSCFSDRTHVFFVCGLMGLKDV